MKNQIDRRRFFFCLAFLVFVLSILLVLNLLSGSTCIPSRAVFSALFSTTPEPTAEMRIIRQIRLPRLFSAALLGGALSVSGYLLQTFFANPIAGPFVLGISSGAKLTVALTMIFCLARGISLTSLGMVTAAFCGALLSMMVVLFASRWLKNMAFLIVCGVMIGYICSAVTEVAVTFADDSNIVNLHNWSMGSFSSIEWKDLTIAGVFVLLAMAGTVFLIKPINAYRLGESYARSMGVNILSFRVELILLASILAATVTAFAGPISFVGIAVPHLIRSMLRSERPHYMLPTCFLGGAVFCLFCDWIARSLFAPTELSISTVTALFGAPIVIRLMLSRRREDRTNGCA